MNIFKYDPDCYSCHNEGWVIGSSFKELKTCPVCKNNRFTRIVKQVAYNLVFTVFGVIYDALEAINWVDENTLEFHRLHNKEAKYRVARKTLIEYASGYDVNRTLFNSSLATIAGKNNKDFLSIVERAHFKATGTHETDLEFVKLLDEMKIRK